MNNIRNKVSLIGNLGMDPEIKEFESGKTLAKLSLATSETYKNAEGKKVTDTQWHNLIAWGSTAKFAEDYLKKGSEVAVEGKLTYRNYEDKNGNKRSIAEILVSQFLMTGSKGGNKAENKL